MPAGLSTTSEVLVLVRDAEVERCCTSAAAAGRLELDLLAGLEAVANSARAVPSTKDAAGVEKPLGCGPRANLLEPGEEPVEPS